jgi:hypothetical protein
LVQQRLVALDMRRAKRVQIRQINILQVVRAEEPAGSWLADVDLQQKSREPRWTTPRVIFWSVMAVFGFDNPGAGGENPFYWSVFAFLRDGRYVLAVNCETLEQAQRARDRLRDLAESRSQDEALATLREHPG